MILRSALHSITLLAGCQQPPPTPNPDATKARAPSAVTFRQLPGLGNSAMIVASSIAPDGLPALAKDRCGTEQICTVTAWASDADAARAWPLTDREVETRIFTYSINRSTGFERSQWDCRRFPRSGTDECH